MNITALFVGKTAFPFIREGNAVYEKRLPHYTGFTKIEIPDLKNASSLTQDQIREKEGDLILQHIRTGDFLVVMDEHGKEFSSTEFAAEINRRASCGTRNMVFVIGGAYGFSPKVHQRADMTISLSKMTFSHQMVRMILLEQIYRAFTILKGEPYHHE